MFGPKRIYYHQVNADSESVVRRFLNTDKFIECAAEPYGGAFKQAQKDQLFITRHGAYSFRVSENGGFGGMFEVIGTIDILTTNQAECMLKIKLQIGIFPANFPQLAILVLLIIGVALIPLSIAFLYGILILCIVPLIWWFINFIKIRYFFILQFNSVDKKVTPQYLFVLKHDKEVLARP